MLACSMGRFLVRSRLLSASIVISAAFAAVPSYAAPDATDAQSETVANSPYAATFIVNANAVYVRAGPAESYYPTMKLDKGTKVKAVGMRLDWLKIVPPDGAFCYISKVHVDRFGDTAENRGRVNGDSVNVRAGSTMNAMKVQVLCQLGQGAEVKILGEQDEYYKIAPPEGKAFLYVQKSFVDPDPTSVPEKQAPATVVKDDPAKQPVPPDTKPPQPREVAKVEPTEPRQPVTVENKAGPTDTMPPATQPSNPALAKAGATTQPAADDSATVEASFEKAEADYAAAAAKPIEERPIADLIKQYEPLVASDKLTNTLHRIAETRLATLKIQEKAAGEVARAKAAQEELQKKQIALKAEGDELKERLATLGVASYTAIGELQMSSLQLGPKTLYRLTDPANGRTVCYLRTDDTKVVTHMSKFVGVKGELTTESQLSLKVVTPTEVSEIDASKVNHGISATVMPPSMIKADDATTAAHLDSRP